MIPAAPLRGFPRRPAAWVAGAAALIASLAVISGELGSLGGDNADYVLLARALGDGIGYRTTWAPGPPAPHTLYPPVFPLLLVPFAGAAPGSFLACHVVVAALGAAAVVLLAMLFERRGLPPWAAAAGALSPALSLWWLRCSADVLSELPFLFFVAWALLSLEPGEEERLPARRIALAAVLAGLAFGTRTAGLALVLPVAAALSLDRRTRGRAGWIAAAALLAACGAWFLYGRLAGEGGGYADQLTGDAAASGGLIGRSCDGLNRHVLPWAPRYFFLEFEEGGRWDAAGLLLWGAALAALAAGILRRKTLSVAEALFLAYLAMQSAWPFWDPRFVLPLAALLGLLAVESVHAVAVRWTPRPALLTTAFALLLLAPNAVRLFTHVLPRAHRNLPAAVPGHHDPSGFTESWRWSDGQYHEAAPPLAAFLHACDLVRRGEVPGGLPEGPVLALNPRVAALLCGRTAVKAPAGGGPDEVASLVREKGVAVVLVDEFPGSEALRAFRDAPPPWVESALSVPGGAQVLRVRR